MKFILYAILGVLVVAAASKVVDEPLCSTSIVVTTNYNSLGTFKSSQTNELLEVLQGQLFTQTVHTVNYHGKKHYLVLEEHPGVKLSEHVLQPISGGPGSAWTTMPNIMQTTK